LRTARDERAADFAAQLSANGNVLKIRIAAGQAAGDGGRLTETGMHASGAARAGQRQRIHVRAAELLQLAVFQQRFKHGVAGLAL